MNSLACDRISPRASARSFAAAVTRSLISVCTFAGFRVAQSMRGPPGAGGAGTHFGHHLTTVVGSMVRQFDAANSISASQESHSADQLRAGNRAMLGITVNSPIVSGGTAWGPVSGSVTNGRFARSAKNHPARKLGALPPPPALAALPSLPSLPSYLPLMLRLL